MLSDIYYIGGSPCSGKSTLAKMAAQKYGFYYFEVDERLGDYYRLGIRDNKPICMKNDRLSFPQRWMRPPQLQCDEELELYREIFEYILSDLSQINAASGIITEGAAYLPELMHQIGISPTHYINLTPTRDFQYTYYAQRTWVPLFLEGCADKKQAFTNWMERDVLFAEYVRHQAASLGYTGLVTDGSLSIDAAFAQLTALMHLDSLKFSPQVFSF